MRESLKIILFDGSFATTTFINRLAKGLAQKHQVYILGFNEHLNNPIDKVFYIPLGSNQSAFRFIKTSLYWGYKQQGILGIFKTLFTFLNNPRKTLQQRNLTTALAHIKPDVIHLQWPSLLPWFEKVLENQTYPVVLSQRGFHINVRPFVNQENLNYLQKWFPTIAGFHSVSKAISKVGDSIWSSPKKIDHVVYSGFDLKELPFSPPIKQKELLEIISVGRTHWIKGYTDAIEALAILKEKGITFSYTLIGASGDEELMYLIDHFSLQNEVVLSPKITQTEVYQAMLDSSLFLLPSIEEGLPNVVVEAMFLGVPVISTNCGGVPELITDGVEGWLVPTRNPKAMADAIEHFVTLSTATIEKVTLAARKKVEVQHHEQQMCLEMEALYLKVSGRN